MGAPTNLWDETVAMDAVKTFLVACCTEVPKERISRGFPSAVPSKSNGPSITMTPVTGGPIRLSYMGETSISAQVQVTQVLITAAAEGVWTLHVQGEDAVYNAGALDTLVDIRNGLQAAVDLLGLELTTDDVVVNNAPGFSLTADEPGVSLLVNTIGDPPPAPGSMLILVVDDTLRRTQYNWGQWTLRLVFRDTPSAGAGASNRHLATTLCDRVQNWLEAGEDLPVVNGQASPCWWDVFQDAKLSWMQTMDPIADEYLEGSVWVRAVSLDVVFQVPVGMSADLPSLVEIEGGSLVLSG